ncbi:hypothetical protein P9112_010107 [Eukaryota sp. TZLM1-RC]
MEPGAHNARVITVAKGRFTPDPALPKVSHPFNRSGKGHVYKKLQRISTHGLLLSCSCYEQVRIMHYPLVGLSNN